MSARRKINLALQGGGSHGAFTWGVLDRLLQDDSVQIEAISGTSAGAMNAVVMADGLERGGPTEASAQLGAFWREVANAARLSPIQRTPIDVFMGNWSLDHSPGYVFMDLMSRVASPYQVNPLNINPLRDILAQSVDFERVHNCDSIKLYISATNVHTGRIKVFDHNDLSIDMVMASACLPFIFQAVEIDNVPYWDGGYMGNPALFPLFPNTDSSDIIIVKINPIERRETPTTAPEILNRLNEISFNSSLLRELRAINFVRRLLDRAQLDENEYRRVNIHIVSDDDAILPLGASSKLNAELAFLEHLHDAGWQAADRWLEKHRDDIGVKSTVDLRAMFQGA